VIAITRLLLCFRLACLGITPEPVAPARAWGDESFCETPRP
jgi:hypothetical protein